MTYRLSASAQADIARILAWSEEQFGVRARERYQALIVAAIRDAANADDGLGAVPRPELGTGVFSWHLSRSRTAAGRESVAHPRHFLLLRRDGDVLVVGRVLHDAMDPRRHPDPSQP